MALPIKHIPQLKGDDAKEFVLEAEKSKLQKKSIDFSEQSAIAKRIIEKSKRLLW